MSIAIILRCRSTPVKLKEFESGGNGYVGIGTTTPSERLSVYGNIRAVEVKVTSNGWPDYVFDKDYKTTPLVELEKYIRKNKHLPEMPAAATVERNGLSLGKMNTLMLKKVEELTLHLIEKDKQLSLQANQMSRLESRLEKQEKIIREILKKMKL